MSRSAYLARLERERLQAVEARGKARLEALAVAEGVRETVALSAARGAAFEGSPGAARGKPVRRLTGLEWLSRKGRLDPGQRQAGERYGLIYRRATSGGKIGSSLNLNEDGGAATPISAVMSQAEARAKAVARLADLRVRLAGHAGLISACDRICGEELTPMQAAGAEREALKLEAVLGVALDLLKIESSHFVLDPLAGFS